MLIIIEGIDGSYKSTVATKLSNKLNDHKFSNILIRQPGGTPIAEALRNIVKQGHDSEEMTLYTETMLFLGARSQVYTHVVEPALSNGQSVISDRCNLSTIAYQSYKGMDKEFLTNQITSAPWYKKADFLVVIDVPVDVAERRISVRGEESDRLELRLNHCSKVYRDFDASLFAKNVIRINAIENGRELTSDEIMLKAFEKITKGQEARS